MSVMVTIRFEEDGDDVDYQATLLSVPQVGEFLSIGSLSRMHRFEVQRVWHHHLDDELGLTLFCRKLEEREQPGTLSEFEQRLIKPGRRIS